MISLLEYEVVCKSEIVTGEHEIYSPAFVRRNCKPMFLWREQYQ